MRFYETKHNFKNNWDQVATAFWRRYPNPCSSHVLSEDIIQRFIDNQGILFSKRLISKTNKAPKWTERFLPTKIIFIIEESKLDPVNKILVTYTRNIGLKNLMTVDEKVTYKQNPENTNWTIAERQAWVNSSVFGLSKAVQAFGIERFKHNVSKACKGFQYVLDTMFPNIETELNKSIDINALNPMLKEKIREKANEIAAAAKSKAVPFVAAAQTDQREQQT